MSTLGLSGPPQPTENLWKRLFWPMIQNSHDADLAATRGFWICLALAFVSITTSANGLDVDVGLSLTSWLNLAVLLFYFLGATGVRQASLSAALAMFAAYLMGTMAYFWAMPLHFSFIRLVCLALLLTNVRATLLIRKWKANHLQQDEFEYGPSRLSLTWRDKIVDTMPARVWPWGRIIFYGLLPIFLVLDSVGFWAIVTHHLSQ